MIFHKTNNINININWIEKCDDEWKLGKHFLPLSFFISVCIFIFYREIRNKMLRCDTIFILRNQNENNHANINSQDENNNNVNNNQQQSQQQ